MTPAERRVVDAAIDAYRGFYCTLTHNNLVNATRALLGGEVPRDEYVERELARLYADKRPSGGKET